MMSQKDCLEIHDIKGNLPVYNVKSSLVSCKGTDYVFLFGGFDEMDALDSNVYLLNLLTMTWETDDKHIGLYREGHLAVYIGNGNILVFGGIPYDEFPEPSPNQRTDDSTFRKDSLMMIYNIFDRKWIGPPKFALDNAPFARSRHACCLSPDGLKVYISGGLVKSSPLDDLYCYDMASGTWSGPIRFVSRFDHFITIHNDKIFSFGGLDKDMNHVKNAITYYSLTTRSIGEISILQKPQYSFSPFVGDDVEKAMDKYVPSDCERIYLDTEVNDAIKLDVCLPVWSATTRDITMSFVSVDDYEFQDLFTMDNLVTYFKVNHNIDFINYTWKNAVAKDSSIYILGAYQAKSRVPNEETNDPDNQPDQMDEFENNEHNFYPKLSCLMKLHLSDFGIPNSHHEGTIPLVNDFERLLKNEECTDFEIYTLANEYDKQTYQELSEIEWKANTNLKCIKVHKSILLARWPHFARMIATGMHETILNKMLIPEPYLWIRALVYYLYTGSMEFEKYLQHDLTILDFSGLLIMANMYELLDFSNLLLHQLFTRFEIFKGSFVENDENISILLKLWKDLSFSNETIFIVKVIDLIKKCWGSITRANPFLELSKDEIVSLCQDCSLVLMKSKNPKRSLSPSSNTTSIESSDNLADPETPSRNTHSPFVIDSPRQARPLNGSFASLQNLTNALSEHIS